MLRPNGSFYSRFLASWPPDRPVLELFMPTRAASVLLDDAVDSERPSQHLSTMSYPPRPSASQATLPTAGPSFAQLPFACLSPIQLTAPAPSCVNFIALSPSIHSYLVMTWPCRRWLCSSSPPLPRTVLGLLLNRLDCSSHGLPALLATAGAGMGGIAPRTSPPAFQSLPF